ncbi:MAG: DUF559 domain-containing protein, partial [Prevotella sp.]|nr:DUF559 domain-containing protein [Prevotella sp.]
GPYVLDFFCYKLNLCIELDGEAHQKTLANERDLIRTKYLNDQGITVLRFSNDVVLKNMEGIMLTISYYAQEPSFMPGWHINEIMTRSDLP